MTTAEATGVFIGSIPTDGHESEPLVYFDQCGWSGYVWGGVDRMYFRFADSEVRNQAFDAVSLDRSRDVLFGAMHIDNGFVQARWLPRVLPP